MLKYSSEVLFPKTVFVFLNSDLYTFQIYLNQWTVKDEQAQIRFLVTHDLRRELSSEIEMDLLTKSIKETILLLYAILSFSQLICHVYIIYKVSLIVLQ